MTIDSGDFGGKVDIKHCQHFVAGLALLKDPTVPDSLLGALKNFKCAYQQSPHDDFYHNKYASYLGLTRFLTGDGSGLELCRDIASQENFDGDVFLNLAYAEWVNKNRARTIDVLEKGLLVDQFHPGLNRFKKRLGARQKTAFEFIPRDSFLNVALGKLARSKDSAEEWDYSQLI